MIVRTPIPALSPGPGAPVALSDLAVRTPRLIRRMSSAHAALLLLTTGRAGARWFGAPLLVLETVGRRTGKVRVTPLVYLPDEGDLVVVPANAGAERTPAWWLNLRAAGEGTAVVGRERRRVVPTVTSGARRERLWRRFCAVSRVDHYQGRALRELPVVALAPAAHPATAPRSRSSSRRPVLAPAFG